MSDGGPNDSDDDTNAGAGGENLYLKAIHHPERDEQLLAMHQFISKEIEDHLHRLEGFEAEDGSVPEENVRCWNYEKGRLDALRTLQGLVTQAGIVQCAFEAVDDPGAGEQQGPSR